tara:strand:+ start:1656 stop:2114 length:459 start_codon:yes stop_codon:yes gene_type:complete
MSSPCLYAVQYEKDLVKKNEEIAELKAELKVVREVEINGLCGYKTQIDELKAENEKLKSDKSCMVDKQQLSLRLGYGSLTEHFDWVKAVIGMRKDAERIERLYTELTGKSAEVGGAIWLAEADAWEKKMEEDIADICVDVKVGEGDVGWEKY